MWSDDDRGFLARLERAELGHREFGHREHLRAVWLYLRDRPLGAALDAMRDGLRRLSAAHGNPERYDEALTRAWVELVAEAMARDGAGADFDALLAANPELLEKEAGARRARFQRPL
jgi:hypothetical protein